jgi:hypothetical protein
MPFLLLKLSAMVKNLGGGGWIDVIRDFSWLEWMN